MAFLVLNGRFCCRNAHIFDSITEHSLKLPFSKSVQLVLEIKEVLILKGLEHGLPGSISE